MLKCKWDDSNAIHYFFHQQHKNCKIYLETSKDTQPLYTTKILREARKNIIASVDHILQHDLIQENPLAAEFVSTMGREMQNIKECFNTKMLFILGSKNGRDNELCYPSFKNKKTDGYW